MQRSIIHSNNLLEIKRSEIEHATALILAHHGIPEARRALGKAYRNATTMLLQMGLDGMLPKNPEAVRDFENHIETHKDALNHHI